MEIWPLDCRFYAKYIVFATSKPPGASVAKWLELWNQNHKASHLCRRVFESRLCRYVSKFASLLADGRWSLPRYIVFGLSPPPTKTGHQTTEKLLNVSESNK